MPDKGAIHHYSFSVYCHEMLGSQAKRRFNTENAFDPNRYIYLEIR